MGVPARHHDVLKLVHPGRHVEIFQEPIMAGELMRKYPRHCIARPDVFEFPWISVHPESVLRPGKVFYLVPYHTMDKILKTKSQQQQQQESLVSSIHKQSSKLSFYVLNYNRQGTPIKRRSSRRNVEDQETCRDIKRRDSEAGCLYRLEFRESWNKIRRNQDQVQESWCYQLDAQLDSSRTCFSILRNGRPRVRSRSPEQIELLRIKPCLSKPDSVRKKLNLRVTFASPVVISSSQRGSPGDRLDEQVFQV